MSAFIIDHETHNVNKTIRLLGRRKNVRACQFFGQYREDLGLCQIYVETDMNEGTLDHWLWATKSVGDYIAVCETENRDTVGTITADMVLLRQNNGNGGVA
ncbi:hypothetical protein LCGC14_0410940 [marine sediment metagenome]|uniref:Uncharacterized protein n=1 Tax=marine sediment metagenome TaxID=412755 RepID=A0A0F9W2W7_9ZZZZ